MNSDPKRRDRHRSSLAAHGMSLVEVAMALGIAAFAIVVIIGLLPTGLTSSQESRSEQTATDILTEIETDVRLLSSTQTRTPRLSIFLPAVGSAPTEAFFSAQGLLVPDANDAFFRATITRRSPTNPALDAWHILVHWPVTDSTPQGAVETVVIMPNLSRL